MKLWSEFTKCFIRANPLFVIALGNCPALAMTMGLDTTVGMTGALVFVLLGSSILISSIKNVVPNIVRIPVFIVVISSFVTMADLFIHGYSPDLYKLMGIFLPLITVN